MTKTPHITIRLTPEDRQALELLSAWSGDASFASVIRGLLREAIADRLCPECGKDRFPEDAVDSIRELLRKLDCVEEAMNPGGREFWFADGSRLQVHDLCDNCTIISLTNKLGDES